MKSRLSKLLQIVVILCAILLLYELFSKNFLIPHTNSGDLPVPDWVEVQLINIDGSSRRGEKLEDVKDIVVHYVGNPGTTAKQNRGFFANPESGISSHFLIGLEGEVLQCVPLDEKSSASNWRNTDTISIEVCHPDETGKFNEDSYQALVRLTAWLCKNYNLETEHVIRHYDVTKKECPRYFVQHEDAWLQFKEDVASYTEPVDK